MCRNHKTFAKYGSHETANTPVLCMLMYFLDKNVVLGSGSVILPGVNLECGVAVGALSLIKNDCKEYGMYAGNPARRIKERKCNFLDLARLLAMKDH